MIDHPHLRELRELLSAFVERPLPGVLVLGCRDEEILHIIHALDTLDGNSPADRFLLHLEPFITAESYVDQLAAHVATATSSAPAPAGAPLSRLQALFAAQLAALPKGDHRLVVALQPRRIDDPAGFSALASALLAEPHPHPLRLILRDDLANPIHLHSAEENPSEQVIGYRFHLPAVDLLAASTAPACNLTATPDIRAQSLLQLATLSLARGRIAEAVIACETALTLTRNPILIALALAFCADALRTQGNHKAAVIRARTALQCAAKCGATPVVHHAAMTLGALSHELGNPRDAAACFALAERTAPHPQIAALARQRRTSPGETECPC